MKTRRILALGLGMLAISTLSTWAAPIDILTPADTQNDQGVILTVADPKGTGSGSFNSFVRFGGGKDGLSKGINTDMKNLLDDKPPFGQIQGTLDIQANQIQVNADGYYVFRFDAGNAGGAPLTLQAINIYVSPTKVTDPVSLSKLIADDAGSPGHPVFYSSNPYNVKEQSGNGVADLFMLVPQSLISDDSWVYLYTEAGGQPFPDTGTFNEWAFQERTRAPPNVPDAGATMMLLGVALVAVEGLRRKLSA